MKKITESNYLDILQKNRSLVKGSDDPTVVYVFSGHPYDSYEGGEVRSTLLLYSLTTNEYTRVRASNLEGGKTRPTYYLIEDEKDALQGLQGGESETYGKFLDRVKKVFG